jgi:UTP--glucose-1-phosphate uridylyltransferase
MIPEYEPEQTEPRYLVIPAAGLGTRMRGVDPDVPKELLPVDNKPAIIYAVEEGLSAGIQNFIIIISKQKEVIRQHLEEKVFPNHGGSTSTYVYQEEPLGESDAISHAEDIVGTHAAAIIYPDNLYVPAPGALKILKSAFNKYHTDVVALSEVSENIGQTISNAGRVDITYEVDNIFRIKRFHPKTRGHFAPRFKGEMRACGIYISGPHIFSYIKKVKHTINTGEITDTPVRSLSLTERGVLGCRLPGTVFDIGNPAGYALCKEHMRESGRRS